MKAQGNNNVHLTETFSRVYDPQDILNSISIFVMATGKESAKRYQQRPAFCWCIWHI